MKCLSWFGLAAILAISSYTLARANDDAPVELQTQIFQVSDIQASYIDTATGEAELITLLRKLFPPIVDPTSGEMRSYMRFNLTTGQLVVRNTPENLRNLQTLFDLMRRESEQRAQ